MKIFATSDTHFSHRMLVERGFRPENFESLILKNLSKAHGDILIHCGDFCIGDDADNHYKFLSATTGFRIRVLVRGNHDNKSDQWYYEHGWDFVCDTFTQKIFGKHILFSHIPVLKTEKFDLNIHGHLHGSNHREMDFHASLYDKSWHKDLAPEIHNYSPVNIEKLL